jgi:hypothetical protein
VTTVVPVPLPVPNVALSGLALFQFTLLVVAASYQLPAASHAPPLLEGLGAVPPLPSQVNARGVGMTAASPTSSWKLSNCAVWPPAVA